MAAGRRHAPTGQEQLSPGQSGSAPARLSATNNVAGPIRAALGTRPQTIRALKWAEQGVAKPLTTGVRPPERRVPSRSERSLPPLRLPRRLPPPTATSGPIAAAPPGSFRQLICWHAAPILGIITARSLTTHFTSRAGARDTQKPRPAARARTPLNTQGATTHDDNTVSYGS